MKRIKENLNNEWVNGNDSVLHGMIDIRRCD